MHICVSYHHCFLILPITKQPNNEGKFPISVFYTLLRLNGFPLYRVAPNVVFLYLCLYIINEKRKKEGVRLREIICPGSVAYWAQFGYFLFGDGVGGCHHFPTPIPPNCGDSQICIR